VLGRVRPGLGIGVDVLLEEPDREITTEFDGPLLPLIEGEELILVLRIKHQVKGGRGVGEPALAKGCVIVLGLGLRVVHGGSPDNPVNQAQIPTYHIPAARAQKRDCTRGGWIANDPFATLG
jgi:hypothetical protein